MFPAMVGHAVRMLIRTHRPADADARVALKSEAYPHELLNVAGMHAGTVPPPELRYLGVVAEVDGRVVGEGALRIEVMDRTTALETISVAPDSRRKGVGSAIHAVLLKHLATLDVSRLKTQVTTPEGRAFAERDGFTAGRVWRISSVDPRLAPPVPRIPDGIELKPLAAVADLAALYALYQACGTDMPGNTDRPGFPYEDWLRFSVNSPLADRDCSIVAYDGGAPVAFTFINSSDVRASNSLAGTARPHRGRGLATLVKTVSLHKAAAKGITRAYTANSEDNAPMLAVNTRLGYTPALEEVSMTRPAAESA